MKAKDIITRHVISISSQSLVLQAAQMLLRHRVSGLPVIDVVGDLVGVVTKEDILRPVETGTERHSPDWHGVVFGTGKLAEDYAHLRGLKVREVMSKDFYSIAEDASLDEIVQFMERLRFKWLPVVRDRKLVGVVNRHGLDSAKLLLRRMAALNLDEKAVVKSKPVVMRELQRLCSTCASQKRCKIDLANDPQNPVWRQYCRNAGGFFALQQQPAAEMLIALAKALEAATA